MGGGLRLKAVVSFEGLMAVAAVIGNQTLRGQSDRYTVSVRNAAGLLIRVT